MVKRMAAILMMISFCLLAACRVFCQNERRGADLPQGAGSNSADVRSQQMLIWRSLPDAPVVQPLTQEKHPTFFEPASAPLTPGAPDVKADLDRKTGLSRASPGLHLTFAVPHETISTRTKASIFVSRYLYPSVLKPSLSYHPSTSGNLINRTAHAASRIFITCDESGKERLNTSYFLGALTSVAMRTARRPYWTRSGSAPFGDFGSTVGNDAGINLLHEFGPGIRNLAKVHGPKFVSRIEKNISPSRTTGEVVATSGR